MTPPNTFYQDHATVIEAATLATKTHRLRLATPRIAETIEPGQFVMVKLPGTDPLLGRAFALYETILNEAGQPAAIDIVYSEVGKVTSLLPKLRPGDVVEVWGPLGKAFPIYKGAEHVAVVAGGIGQTPFVALLKRMLGLKGYHGPTPQREVPSASMYYGARSSHYFAGLGDFAATGADLHLSTDDGSAGYQGYVTALLAKQIESGKLPKKTQLVGCGPEPMLHALAKVAAQFNLSCDVSLETPMACGIGICFSCVTKVKQPGDAECDWDYKRVCVEGPIFDAKKLVW